jgi:hypothetical protein
VVGEYLVWPAADDSGEPGHFEDIGVVVTRLRTAIALAAGIVKVARPMAKSSTDRFGDRR